MSERFARRRLNARAKVANRAADAVVTTAAETRARSCPVPRHTVPMNVVAQILAVLAGLAHVAVFVLESLLLRRPQVYRLFLIRAEDVAAVRLWAANQGFYNLFLAAGAIGGVVTLHAGNATVGRTLALFACACMAAAGIVLFLTERRLWRGAIAQAVPPLIVLAATLL
jgi:putative membrane protein